MGVIFRVFESASQRKNLGYKGPFSPLSLPVYPCILGCQRSSAVEQRFRKPQVDGSNPSVGSTVYRITKGLLALNGRSPFLP